MASGDGEPTDALDLSGQGLKKIPKAVTNEAQCVTSLLLDKNELQRWDNIESYPKLQKLTARHNQMMRMYGISRLHHLHTLNLSNNCILSIEGLKEMIHLRWLCLSSNKIKTIEHLHTNTSLEHLDLSENNIAHVSDLSFLKELTTLFLHGNRISQLRQCERFLPTSIETLTLAANKLTDLNEMSHLGHLTSLREITIMNNPCVDMTGHDCIGFDYRPFMINWCMSLKVIDGAAVDAIESLKAEWLYSQGRGHQFRVGEHAALSEYLATVCPLAGDVAQPEEDRKLQLILSKAQQHAQQLKVQQVDGPRGRTASMYNRSVSSPAPSPAGRRRINSASSGFKHGSPSPRRTASSRLPVSDRSRSPDRMAASLHSAAAAAMVGDGDVMSRSLDPFLLFSSAAMEREAAQAEEIMLDDPADASSGALQGASKLVPVPETLMSPEYQPQLTSKQRSIHTNVRNTTPVARNVRPKSSPVLKGKVSRPTQGNSSPSNSLNNHSSDEDSEYSSSKLDSILQRAQQRRQTNCSPANPLSKTSSAAEVVNANGTDGNLESAALCIQRIWRGYRTRNVDRKVVSSIQALQMSRTNEYIQQLSSNMEQTIAALEHERQLQVLQMQAISALWKKVSGPPTEEGTAMVNLSQTCSQLHSQVSQLQESMNGVLQRMDTFCRPVAEAVSTQTDIVAVHTPQSETAPFPYQRTHPRPSTLPLAPPPPEEVEQFATSLVDGVLKDMASGDGENAAEDAAEIVAGIKVETEEVGAEGDDKDVKSLVNGNGAEASTVYGEMLSLEENSSSIMICKQPPSSVNTPMDSEASNSFSDVAGLEGKQ